MVNVMRVISFDFLILLSEYYFLSITTKPQCTCTFDNEIFHELTLADLVVEDMFVYLFLPTSLNLTFNEQRTTNFKQTNIPRCTGNDH